MLPLTVGDLRKILADDSISDDDLVSYERIEDACFDNTHGWSSEPVEDSLMPDYPDEYIDASIVWYDKDKNKLRITAHY